MSFNFSPKIITDKLVFCIDAANMNSYPGGGTVWNPLVDKYEIGGTLVNGPIFSSENLGTIVFDGTDDYVQSNITYADKIVEKMSFDVWLKRTQDTGHTPMVFSCNIPYLSFRGSSAGGGNGNKFLFSFVTQLSGAPTQRYLYSINTYTDNVWYNVVCTLDIDTISGTLDSKMYIDGELINTYSLPSSSLDSLYPTSTINRLRLGYYTDSYPTPLPFKGNIPTFKIYEKILSADEVKQNYNALKNRYI